MFILMSVITFTFIIFMLLFGTFYNSSMLSYLLVWTNAARISTSVIISTFSRTQNLGNFTLFKGHKGPQEE
jgi:hypothetical protein